MSQLMIRLQDQSSAYLLFQCEFVVLITIVFVVLQVSDTLLLIFEFLVVALFLFEVTLKC